MDLDSILNSGFEDIQDNLLPLERGYERLKRIGLLIQQYLYESEHGYGGEVGKKIKEIVEKRLARMGVTNEEKLLALYWLDEPYKNFSVTKKMIEEYEKIADVSIVKDMLEKIKKYEMYIEKKRLPFLEPLDRLLSHNIGKLRRTH